ncbi:hypothetical protein [Deinococcus kurensis]|uniref:hypothetical protein n=1 Tax=Deinococcus kurensis TaxID=2662757 RepID=UPI0012D2D1F6|nr:hypothetical protein [Deinococcus kurensis]
MSANLTALPVGTLIDLEAPFRGPTRHVRAELAARLGRLAADLPGVVSESARDGTVNLNAVVMPTADYQVVEGLLGTLARGERLNADQLRFVQRYGRQP